MINEIQQVSQQDQNPETQTVTTPEVKMIPQTDVNQIAGHARQKGEKVGYEKGYGEAIASLKSQVPASSLDEERARKIAEDTFNAQIQALNQKAQEEAAKQHGMKVLNELGAKITADKQNIPDFDKVVNMQDFVNAPEVLHLANSVDNSGHVLYELIQNPSKLNTIIGLARNGLPSHAFQAVRQISDSIKQNQTALQQPKSPEPINQIKPSNHGLGNGGQKSVSDMRKDPSYRG